MPSSLSQGSLFALSNFLYIVNKINSHCFMSPDKGNLVLGNYSEREVFCSRVLYKTFKDSSGCNRKVSLVQKKLNFLEKFKNHGVLSIIVNTIVGCLYW